MAVARITLGALGIGLVGIGGWNALTALTTGQLVGLSVWLAAALAVHDVVIAPATAALSALLERNGSRLRPAARGVIRVGFVVSAILTLIVAPLVVAQAQGNANPTVLAGAYAARLGWSLLSIALATIAGVVVVQRSSHGHDA